MRVIQALLRTGMLPNFHRGHRGILAIQTLCLPFFSSSKLSLRDGLPYCMYVSLSSILHSVPC